MKTLHLIPALEQGGVETVVCGICRLLTEEGWETAVVSAGGRLASEVERVGARHLALDVKSKNPLTYFRRAASLRRLLEAERPDVVVAHSRVPAWLCRRALRPLGIPWMTFAHGANSVSRYSAVMTAGDLVLVPSQFVADYLSANYVFDRSKLRVVPPAVDPARFDPSRLDSAFMAGRRREWRLDGAFTVMAVGRLSPVKGYDTLIRAFARLDRATPVRLVIVGSADARHSDCEASLRALAAALGCGDEVVFAGAQSKVAECLALADVVVSSNTAKPESFGLSMAEALTMGRPVVAKAFGGALDVVRDGPDGILVRDAPDPAEAFAAALERVRANPSECGERRASALARFSPAALRTRFVSVCRELVGR